MFQWIRVGVNSRGVWLLAGVLVGMAVAGYWPDTPTYAVATDRYEDFAICTSPVDEEVEALYFLDFLTGNLQAAVLSTQTGAFNAFYERNIIKDLELGGEKKPRYLMVSGMAELRRGAAQARPSAAIVYVAEATTGRVAAYFIPWVSGQRAANVPVEAPLQLLNVTKFRTATVRDE